MKVKWKISDEDFSQLFSESEFKLEDLGDIVENYSPNSCFPYVTDYSCRLSENWRSCLVGLEGDYCLVIKGSELKSPDLDDCYHKIFDMVRVVGSPTLAQHFVFKENKFPLALETSEAIEEALTTTNLVNDYFSEFGLIPRMPIPLFVFEYEQQDLKKAKSYLKSIKEKFRMERRPGEFAVFAYLFKGHPSRLKHWKILTENPQIERKMWEIEQKDFFNSDRIINEILGLFSCLVQIGWILTPVGQDHIGYGLKSQNITLDGGIVDVGNAYKVSKITKGVVVDLINSINVLTSSMSSILVQAGRMEEGFQKTLISNFVINEVSKRLENKSAPLADSFRKIFCSGSVNLVALLNDLMDSNLNDDIEIIL
jgi:hypothetical protein